MKTKKIGNIEITLISAPKYYIKGQVFNEYEIRCLMADVAEHKKPEAIDIVFIDEKKNGWRILKNGTVEGIQSSSQHIHGFDYSGNQTLRLIKNRREEEMMDKVVPSDFICSKCGMMMEIYRNTHNGVYFTCECNNEYIMIR